jgi:orotidine-5'-phosphate decarboxylase
MLKDKLVQQIRAKQSFLCVGLDPDLSKMPERFLKEEDPIFTFNKAVIEATADLCVAYKPNLAFFEVHGPRGMESFQKTLELIPDEILTIADAKRGDIGNTAQKYASTFFEYYGVDAATVSPYMGVETMQAWVDYEDKWTVVMGLTSNPGADDFEMIESVSGEKVYERVISRSAAMGDNVMFVVGATRPEKLGEIRKLAPNHFFLVPGVGAQGGDLSEVYRHGANEDCGLLVNSSRQILYPKKGDYSNEDIREAAQSLASDMRALLEN